MIRKLVAIAVSLLINFAVLAWLHAWSTAAVASAAPPPQHADQVILLPTITVRPTRAQIESLRRGAGPVGTNGTLPTGGGGIQTLVKPYYSFAGASGSARDG